ncbi:MULTISPECIES: Bug family tripartite tricarboxylate transporter substrate binding protein [Bordetella]|uniref:Bug family tripartite tricarboxylate transporter substrate binding protein n=1 Tax=Bordetella TaxID=517 RepID=UPI0009763C78|nr:tripartite tricarboxylate transporter substrate binding protein [Bordetella pertussis]AWQ07979.1 LacI family transcriptional regulator [Bordetella bronchiseptica]PNP05374.1 tripartite tricarboxylate transporter substrate binding protein [Bordetella pertussis 18323]AQB17726.1 LacI family transcriptional regulator [Bordetella pertussis]AQC41082.1 LacI family transcriptional regulator [Bordetella pertussis]
MPRRTSRGMSACHTEAVQQRRNTMKWIASMALALCAGGAFAADYPARPITLIVPYGPGGTNDILARAIANKISPTLGQTVVVNNRPGAGGNIGAQQVATAEPDGYTLLLASSGVFAVNKWLYRSLRYDPAQAFAPVILAGSVPNVLIVDTEVPAKTLPELVKYAKSAQPSLNYASMGTGTSGHLCAELFKAQAGIEAEHIAYPGSAAALTALLGHQVQLMCDNLPTALPQIKAGRARALAVSSAERAPLLPDTPTVAESGFPGFDATAWFGIAAPAGTPAPIVERLNKEINAALQAPDVARILGEQGVSFRPNTPAQFSQFISAESAKWRDVIERTGSRAD